MSLLLYAVSLPLLAGQAQSTTLTFQGRLHDITTVTVGAGVSVPATSDLIFVKTADGKKFLAIPLNSLARGDYDITNQRFYMLNSFDGNVVGINRIDATLINLNGTFFSDMFQDPSAAEIFSKPVSIPSTEIPTDITVMDAQRIGYRTDGPSLNDTQGNPINDEKVYVITRASSSNIELPTLDVPLKDADLAGNHASVYVEWDAINQTFLLLQSSLSPTRNTNTSDRMVAFQRDGTVKGTVFFTTDGNNTPVIEFPTYSGSIGGVTLDPETNTVYILDPPSRRIFVLTPRQTAITNVVPAQGGFAGGTAVTLNGVNFPSDAQVFFDGIAATNVVVVSTEQITCVTPAHAIGAVTVSITGSGIPTGSPVTLANGFTYINNPPTALLKASPSRGPAPLTVSFDITGITDSDGTIASRVINFGDGGSFTFPPNLAVTTTTYTYLSEGTFLATLSVVDNMGGSAVAEKVIVVGDEAPLTVRSLAIKAGPELAGKASKDAFTLKGEFLLPEDFDMEDAKLSVGFADSDVDELGAHSDTPFVVNSAVVNNFERKIGGHYNGLLEVPTRNDLPIDGRPARLNEKDRKFSYKAIKKPGFTPGTVSFTFSGKAADLDEALVGAEVLPVTGKQIRALTIIVRFIAGANDVLQFKKKVVVEVKSGTSSKVNLTRR